MGQTGIVTLTGYVTADPKLRHTNETKTPVTHVRIGCTPRRVDRETGEWKDGATSYFNVNCWRKLAINVSSSLRKGDPVIVKGRFRTRSWAEEGRIRTEVEIDADTMGHDLALGWAHFLRNLRVPPNVANDLAEGETIRAAMAAARAGGDDSEVAGFAAPDRPGNDEPGASGAARTGPDDPVAPYDGYQDQDEDPDDQDIIDDQAVAEFAREIDEGIEVPA